MDNNFIYLLNIFRHYYNNNFPLENCNGSINKINSEINYFRDILEEYKKSDDNTKQIINIQNKTENDSINGYILLIKGKEYFMCKILFPLILYIYDHEIRNFLIIKN